MSNVSDEIGEKYKEWKNYDTIFITAPTGKGKTYLILHNLLKYLIDNPKPIIQNGISMGYEKILYLVNRKILKEQIEKEIEEGLDKELYVKLQELQADTSDFIEVMTYQKIEEELKSTYYKSSILYHLISTPYKYIIYDECHYFSVDSTYNTFTELSYDFLRNIFFKKIQIFLSATMENIKGILENRKEYCHIFSQFKDVNMFIHPDHYTLPADYSKVTIRVIKDKKILKDLILDNQRKKDEKWLIFTDSINQGKKLKEELSTSIDKEDEDSIVFIDAQYKKEESSYEIVNQIVSKSYSSAKILIATSVMDNGISIKDIKLRNVVIMADTKETFLQMLGRKRYANEEDDITVYIMQRDLKHFTHRYQYYSDILYFYKKHKNKLKSNLNAITQFLSEEYKDASINDLMNDLLNNALKQPYILDVSIKTLIKQQPAIFNFYSSYIEKQQEVLEEVLKASDVANKLIYPYKASCII